MVKPSHIPIELGPRETWGELVYLLKRARRIWVRVLVVSIALTAVYAARAAMKQQMFWSRVVLRLQEGEGEYGTRPPPAPRLRGHVQDVIFNKKELRALADRFGLEKSAFRRDPEQGFENLRDAIEVEVWQNYFLDNYDVDNRTARVGITFTTSDPQLALEVARALAATFIEAEQQARLRLTEDALGANEELIDEARDAVQAAEARVASSRVRMRTSRDPARTMLEINDAERQQKSAALSLRNLEKRRSELELQLGYERNQLGLHMEIVDPGRAQKPRFARPVRLALSTAIAFVIVLFGSALLLAAFDERVRDRRDLRLVGMPLFGELPSIKDEGTGALVERVKRTARAPANEQKG